MVESLHADRLAEALSASGFVSVVKKSETLDSVRLLCRISNKRAWCSALEYVLLNKSGWTEHVCQQYFLRDGKLIYGWNFILNAQNLGAAVENASKLLSTAWKRMDKPRSVVTRHSDDSMPLMGASPRRTSRTVFDPRLPGPSRGGPSHKGAYTIGGD